MEELIRTNDIVLISFVESLLKEAEIDYYLADQNMSVMEGSLGVLARRILVPAGEIDEARELLSEAGIADELRPARKES